MSKTFKTFLTFSEGSLKTFRTTNGLNFVINVDDVFVSVHPLIELNTNKHEYHISQLSICPSIFQCNRDEFMRIKEIFCRTKTLISNFFEITIDNNFHFPFVKSDIEQLTTLDLLPEEKQKLELVLNDFTYIYLIKDPDSGFTKIGRSNNPHHRLRTLIKQDTLQPKPNKYFFITYWQDRIGIEKMLHEQFSKQRKRGEWFDLTEEDINLIKISYGS